MLKTVQIGDKEVLFKSSGAIPHIYRRRFGRDIFIDMDQLQKNIKAQKGGAVLPPESLEMFECLAYCFAKHADPSVPEEIEDWLSQFEILDIYNILPELIDMWKTENKTTSSLKKKGGQ